MILNTERLRLRPWEEADKCLQYGAIIMREI